MSGHDSQLPQRATSTGADVPPLFTPEEIGNLAAGSVVVGVTLIALVVLWGLA